MMATKEACPSAESSPRKTEAGKPFRHALCVIAWVAVIVIAAYLLYHVFVAKVGLGTSGDWGAFGDYFAGLMNPLLGFFTVMLLLETLKVSREVRNDTATMMKEQAQAFKKQHEAMDEQLQLLRKEADHREKTARILMIERRLDAALNAWNHLLDSRTILIPNCNRPRDNPNPPDDTVLVEVPIREILYTARGWQRFSWKYCDKQDQNTVLTRADDQLSELPKEIAGYCEMLEGQDVESDCVKYYRNRLRPATVRLREAGVLDGAVKI